MSAPARALACSIGCVDPTTAAGVAMDLRVYGALHVASAVAIAGVTAQNSRAVTGVARVPARFIRAQLEAVWEQAKPRAVCIGLLPDADAIRAVAAFVRGLSVRPAIVIDPVTAASNGYRFLRRRGIAELRSLCALATLVTPNASEAAQLTALPVKNVTQAAAAARALAAMGCAVLVTGGHLRGDACTDVLAVGRRVRLFARKRLARTVRGAGGILAAAIAAYLARGETLEAAILKARGLVRRAFAGALRVGAGPPRATL